MKENRKLLREVLKDGHADEKLDSPRSQRRNYSVRTTEVYERRDAKSR